MITTTDFARQYIQDHPFLEEALYNDLVNLSSLARILQPQIEKATLKDIQLGSIIVALRRLSIELKKMQNHQQEHIHIVEDLTVKSNLVEYTYDNSSTLSERLTMLLNGIQNRNELFFTFTHGVNETTIILNAHHHEILEKALEKEKLISKIPELSSITIRHNKEVVYIPGVHYRILKALAWENISIIESVSAYCEFTVIVESKNVNKAFGILNKFLTNSNV